MTESISFRNILPVTEDFNVAAILLAKAFQSPYERLYKNLTLLYPVFPENMLFIQSGERPVGMIDLPLIKRTVY